jgi:ribosomal protein S18 acetylase RimI-like enzyme
MRSASAVNDSREPTGDDGRPRVRRARKTDLDAIRAVASRAWSHTYRGVIADHAIADLLDASYSRVAAQRWLKMGGISLHVVDLDNTVVGFVTHGNTSESVHEVHAIYVEPAVQGLGMGWALWKTVLQTARDSGTPAIELWVLEQNPVGRTWYERQGGAIVGRDVLWLSDGPHTELRYRFEVAPDRTGPRPGRIVTRAVRAVVTFVGLRLHP